MKGWHRLGTILALSGLAAACGQIWSRSTALSLERDLATLLGTPGLSDSAPNCNVLGTTRTGFCVYEATEAELSSIVAQLDLLPFTVGGGWVRVIGGAGRRGQRRVFGPTRV